MRKNPAPHQLMALGELHARVKVLAENSTSPHVARFVPLVGDLIPKMNGINNKLSRPDQTRTGPANFLDLSRAMKITHDAAYQSVQHAGRLVGEAQLEIGTREDARLGFKKGNQDRTAIIAKFSTMSQPDQMRQIGIWMHDKANGGAMIGMVGEADQFLTGLSPDMATSLRRDFVKAHAPDLATERDALNEAVKIVVAAHRSVKLVADEVVDERQYNEIIRQKAEADADDAAFAPNSAG
jgi:hypothetical protein